MKNSIKERAKKVPKKIKFKVALTVWWLKLRQYFVIKSVCEHNWKYSNDGEVKYCTKCDEREWA
jgi:hypothetical protein